MKKYKKLYKVKKMTKKLDKNSKTYENLLAAYAGESQARVKYEYYASRAKKDGFVQMSNIFDETSRNEKEHAKIWFKLLHNGVPETTENLKDGIKGELYEYNTMYSDFSKTAYEEGYDEIGDLFTQVGAIEKHHADRYAKLLRNIEEDTVFKNNIPTKWKCGNCGHIHVGEEAPDVCPVCDHPQAYFELLSKNY